MKLSLCITTYNRYEMTIQSFEKVLNDPRIDDIVIMDDCSNGETKVKFHTWMLVEGFAERHDKVRFIEQDKNVGMSRNKRDAVSHAKNKWCILFDSDNILDTDYLDAFYKFVVEGDAFEQFGKIKPIENFIFCPDFAKPHFDYRDFKCSNGGIGIRSGIYARRECAHEIKNDLFNCLLNTCNYIVNRDFYLKTYKHNPDHIASDTIWYNYNHLKNDGLFCVIPGMQYFHRVHSGSGFREKIDYNFMQADKVRKLIQQL